MNKLKLMKLKTNDLIFNKENNHIYRIEKYEKDKGLYTLKVPGKNFRIQINKKQMQGYELKDKKQMVKNYRPDDIFKNKRTLNKVKFIAYNNNNNNMIKLMDKRNNSTEIPFWLFLDFYYWF